MFHALDDQPSVISFPPRLFQRGTSWLHESGYRTVNFPALIEYRQRDDPFPERSLLITFDDGYQSVYEQAFPVLQRYGFSATIFLTVGKDSNSAESKRLPSMCERSMLSWREIPEMHGYGLESGAHLRLFDQNRMVDQHYKLYEDLLRDERR